MASHVLVLFGMLQAQCPPVSAHAVSNRRKAGAHSGPDQAAESAQLGAGARGGGGTVLCVRRPYTRTHQNGNVKSKLLSNRSLK